MCVTAAGVPVRLTALCFTLTRLHGSSVPSNGRFMSAGGSLRIILGIRCVIGIYLLARCIQKELQALITRYIKSSSLYWM